MLLATLVTLTLAPGTVACCESRPVPRIVPDAGCAYDTVVTIAVRTIRRGIVFDMKFPLRTRSGRAFARGTRQSCAVERRRQPFVTEFGRGHRLVAGFVVNHRTDLYAREA